MKFFSRMNKHVHDMLTDKEMQISSKRVAGIMMLLLSIPTIYWVIWYKVDLSDGAFDLLKYSIAGGAGLLGAGIAEAFRR